MSKSPLPEDPRGVIREAYRLELGEPECRSIFLDWLLGMGAGTGQDEIRALLNRYGSAQPDHPMTRVLREGLGTGAAPRGRRGGPAGRRGR